MGRHAAKPRTRTRQSVKHSSPEQEQPPIESLATVEPEASEDLLTSLLGKSSAPVQETRSEDKTSVVSNSVDYHKDRVSKKNKQSERSPLTTADRRAKHAAPSTKSKMSADLGLTIATIVLITIAVAFSYFAKGLLFAVCMLVLLVAIAAVMSFAYALRNETSKD